MMLRTVRHALTIACWLVVFFSSVHRCQAVDIYIVSAKGGESRTVLSDDDREFGSPDWSPDGKFIAFDTWKRQSPPETLQDSQIAIVPAAGGDMRLLGPGAMPSWSPDGTQLVCHTYRPNQIVVLNADGNGRKAILDQWGSPRWSPDGRYIITASSRGGLARYDLATGKQTIEVAKQVPIWQGFSIAPNGKRYCFAPRLGNRQRGLGIATYDIATNDWPIRWYIPHLECTHSSWSPDSKRVVFHATQPGKDKRRLFILDTDVQGAKQIQPVAGLPAERYCASPDWSPDGKEIVFVGVPTP